MRHRVLNGERYTQSYRKRFCPENGRTAGAVNLNVETVLTFFVVVYKPPFAIGLVCVFFADTTVFRRLFVGWVSVGL